jgi:hypothetical protein
MSEINEHEAFLRQKETFKRRPDRLVPLLFSGLEFERSEHYWWHGDGKTVTLTIAGTRHDEFSNIDDPGFSSLEPQVWVEIHEVVSDGEVVKSGIEGKLLKNSVDYDEVPFSEPILKPPLRYGVKPKVLIPGDWAGYDYGYQDITVELPVIDENTLVRPEWD